MATPIRKYLYFFLYKTIIISFPYSEKDYDLSTPDYDYCLKSLKKKINVFFHEKNCAAKAIFYCPTMNSNRPRSKNTAKEQALIPEKDSKRKRPRCHVSMEKSSKNYKPLEKCTKPNLLPDVTPQPANFSGKYFRRICHVVEPDPPELFAVFSCHSEWPKQGRGRGESRFDLAH